MENTRPKENKGTMENEVKDMRMDYNSEKLPNQLPDKQKAELEKTRKDMEEFKKKALSKFPFIIALGILPPQSAEKIEDEENIPEADRKEKPIHLMALIPEDKFKDLVKIKQHLVELVKNMKPKVWIHVKTPVDVWNYGLDGKYDLLSAVAMSFPLHDKGFLGSLRVAEIHKSLVLRKFERYIVSYVIVGSMVRGEATKSSDVDVYVLIDDTDVKRMPRIELKEKLRNIIFQYVAEAGELAGVKNKLSPQVYLLTDFWESVKDAHPVIFTMIRDGVPFYDKGTFMPWKLLLKMGKLKPSPEAIDMFMSMGDKNKEIVERRLMDAMIDIYYGVLTPSQALLMLYGLPPPTHKETPKVFKEIFVEKEKMIEKKYADTLEKAVQLFKDYEHEKLKTIKGAEIDSLLKDSVEFIARLKKLREQIEKRTNEKTIDQLYEDVFKLLKGTFGEKTEEKLISSFNEEFITKGKLPPMYLNILKDISKAKKEFSKGKMARHEVEDARKNASLLINHLIEHNQRCDLAISNKNKLTLKSGNKTYELIISGKEIFLLEGMEIKKLNDTKFEPATVEQFNNSLAKAEKIEELKLSKKLLDIIQKTIGEFELVW